MSGYDHDDVYVADSFVDDVYDDEVWLEHREDAELELVDRLLRHGEQSDRTVEAGREAA